MQFAMQNPIVFIAEFYRPEEESGKRNSRRHHGDGHLAPLDPTSNGAPITYPPVRISRGVFEKDESPAI
jgi:hypothetical protein